jgi:hypothetical protein
MSSLPVILVWGGVAILKILNLARNRVLNPYRIWSTTQLNTPHHPHSHTPVYTVYFLWEGGVDQREGRGATVHKYSSFIHGINSSQAKSKIPSMSECISSL